MFNFRILEKFVGASPERIIVDRTIIDEVSIISDGENKISAKVNITKPDPRATAG